MTDYAAQAEAAADLAEVDTTHLDQPHANPNALAVLTPSATPPHARRSGSTTSASA
ncbi:hypothetical protein [Nocardiopsis sp. CNR-923]|uniref:hypothetical protein n=1 Tax=Nocardiopsis sp. CNR-923 TaxID=1904965 RepID=UPI0013018A9D|nr:hypothetical protein [Nocardiopsis sp. CNR-923]